MASGQDTVSRNLISGQADTAPAAAPACAGDVYEELPQHSRLEQPSEVSVLPGKKAKTGKDRCHT